MRTPLSAFYVEDPFQQVVAATIDLVGTGAFVVKTLDTELLYGSPHGTPDQSEDWRHFEWPGPADFRAGFFSNSGSASALVKEHDADPGKPVWVVSTYGRQDGETFGGILYSENGGADWELVFQQYEASDPPDFVPLVYQPTGIVWNVEQKAFFASFFVFDFHQIEGAPDLSYRGEEIRRSADGRTWTLESRNMHLSDSDTTADPGSLASDLAAYCNKPENENRGGGTQKIPDGLQGYNQDTGTFIKPTGLRGFEPFNGAWYDAGLTPSVTVINTDGTSIKPVSVVNCYAVAYFNNVWVAVGGDPGVDADHPGGAPNGTHIAVSFDDGQTWAKVFQNLSLWHAATVSGQRSA